ncbi:MAG: restriction endonuclease subunit S [Gemmatimonadota bacterium]|nr:restriction endonuclease subunit S [Gemmatimonadota bacterium]
MTDGLKDVHREAIIAVIAANDRVERAVLFGSRATGTNTVTSDVDIALFGDRLTLTDRARLSAVIAEIPMAQSVDLLLYNSIRNRTLRERIREDGIEWFRRRSGFEAKQHLDDEENGITSRTERGRNDRWPTVQLGEVVDLLSGFPFRSGDYVSDPEAPRLLRGANIAQGYLRWDEAKRWPQEAAEHLTRYWLRQGDVVIAMDRPWIEAGLKSASVRETDIPALLVQRVARLRGRDQLDTRFLRYVIGCHDFSQYVLSVQTGTAVPHISAQQIKEFEFPLPQIHEQRAIAHVLGTLDDKIELNRRMSETLEAMARALFKSWFVDFDPVRAKMAGRDTGLPRGIADLFPDRMVDSEVGEIPEGWEAATLATAIEIYDRKRIPLNKRQRSKRQGPYPYYGAAGIMDYVDDYLFDGVHILTGEDGSVVDAHGYPIVQYVWGKFWVNNHAHVIKGSAISEEHLYLVLKQTNITAFVTGAVQPKLNQRNLKAIPLVVPAGSTCRIFSRLVAPLFAKLRLNGDECLLLAVLRDTLLPKLMSGEIRVPEAERLVASLP